MSISRPYTYMLICDQTDQKYIGSRVANKKPAIQDVAYMSSSRIIKQMILDGFTFKKQILAEWSSKEEAIEHEILLHACFDVGKNKDFLNKSKQTSTGFTGCGLKGIPNGRRGISNPLLSQVLKGKPNPKTGQALRGRTLPESTRIAMSLAKKGKPPNNKGKKLSESICKKMSESRLGQISPTKNKIYDKKVCSHCGLVGGGPQMTKYHFDNCKSKLS